jgi:hypothetical protein
VSDFIRYTFYINPEISSFIYNGFSFFGRSGDRLRCVGVLIHILVSVCRAIYLLLGVLLQDKQTHGRLERPGLH